jgi:hypothetical protein
MTRFLVGLLIVSAAPSLTSNDVNVRKRAAEAWAAKHGEVKLLDAGVDAEGCLTLRAPADARCEQTVTACISGQAMGSCTGYGMDETDVIFGREDEGGGGVMLEHVSGDDFPEGECSGVMGFLDVRPPTPEEQKRRARESAAEHARCLKAAAKRQAAERIVRHCKVLVVNPCRQEAFLRCTGRNAAEGAPPMGKTLRYSWARTDAGIPEGGEWETPEADE